MSIKLAAARLLFLITLLWLSLLAVSAKPDRPLPSRPPKKDAPPSLDGLWREGIIEYKFTLREGVVCLENPGWPAWGQWDGKRLAVEWKDYIGNYEWNGCELIGWYSARDGSSKTEDRFVKKKP